MVKAIILSVLIVTIHLCIDIRFSITKKYDFHFAVAHVQIENISFDI